MGGGSREDRGSRPPPGSAPAAASRARRGGSTPPRSAARRPRRPAAPGPPPPGRRAATPPRARGPRAVRGHRPPGARSRRRARGGAAGAAGRARRAVRSAASCWAAALPARAEARAAYGTAASQRPIRTVAPSWVARWASSAASLDLPTPAGPPTASSPRPPSRASCQASRRRREPGVPADHGGPPERREHGIGRLPRQGRPGRGRAGADLGDRGGGVDGEQAVPGPGGAPPSRGPGARGPDRGPARRRGAAWSRRTPTARRPAGPSGTGPASAARRAARGRGGPRPAPAAARPPRGAARARGRRPWRSPRRRRGAPRAGRRRRRRSPAVRGRSSTSPRHRARASPSSAAAWAGSPIPSASCPRSTRPAKTSASRSAGSSASRYPPARVPSASPAPAEASTRRTAATWVRSVVAAPSEGDSPHIAVTRCSLLSGRLGLSSSSASSSLARGPPNGTGTTAGVGHLERPQDAEAGRRGDPLGGRFVAHAAQPSCPNAHGRGAHAEGDPCSARSRWCARCRWSAAGGADDPVLPVRHEAVGPGRAFASAWATRSARNAARPCRRAACAAEWVGP